MRTAERTASIDPSTQLTVAITSGEMPWAAVARRFSATAVVARPKAVCRNTRARITVRPNPTHSKIRRSTPMLIPGSTSRPLVGSSLETMRASPPKTCLAKASRPPRMPRVAISRMRAGALASRRITTRWMRAPVAPPNSNASAMAAAMGRPTSSEMPLKKMKAPTMPMAPWAKFTTPEPRYTSTMPRAERAYTDPAPSPMMANRRYSTVADLLASLPTRSGPVTRRSL